MCAWPPTCLFAGHVVFAVFGMMLFAELPIDENTSINRNNHFRNFGSALMCLFRTMSGENWQEMLDDTYRVGPTPCGVREDADWCGSQVHSPNAACAGPEWSGLASC